MSILSQGERIIRGFVDATLRTWGFSTECEGGEELRSRYVGPSSMYGRKKSGLSREKVNCQDGK